MIVYFDISALLILLMLGFSIISRRRYKGETDKSLIILLLDSFFITVFDIISVYLDIYSSGFSLWFIKAVNYGYFISYSFLPLCYIVYIVSLTDIWHIILKSKIKTAITLLPFIIDIILLSVNEWTHILFYFDEQNHYIRGKFVVLLQVVGFLSMLFGCYLIHKYRLSLSKTKRVALYSVYVLVMGTTIIQWLFANYLLTALAITLGIMLIVIMVQRPEERLELNTGFDKFEAYITDVKRVYQVQKPTKLLIVDIANFSSISTVLPYEARKRLIQSIAKSVEKINNKYINTLLVNFYYLDDGRFRLLFTEKDEKKVDLFAEKLVEYFSQTFKISQLDLNLMTYICKVDCLKDTEDFLMLYNFESHFVEETKYEQKVFLASELISKNRFKYSNNINAIIDDALVNKKFQVYYQPIYSVELKRFTSAEALIRLIDEKHGFISPEIFIPIAEKSGAIHKIGEYVLEEVFKFMCSEEYAKLGLDYIEINLSVTQCMQVDLAEKVDVLMKKYHIKPEYINLEITETAAVMSQTVMEENLEKLSKLGISFSLDDYGTGYSNIKRITELPLKIIKLDKTFANNIKKPKMEILLESTVKMMKAMNMKIVVEGVETEEMLNKFKELNCELIQGFYFSKPLPKKDFIDYIERQNEVGQLV